MNTACSSCLELFTSSCDISTTPCGHVFHTECISKWLEDRQENCAQCRKSCKKDQIIKLFFSEANPENNLIAELMEENQKLKTEANEAKSDSLKFQKEVNETKSQLLDANQRCLQIEEQKLKLSKHLEDVKKNVSEVERNFQKEREELNEKAEVPKFDSNNYAMTPLLKAAFKGSIRLYEV